MNENYKEISNNNTIKNSHLKENLSKKSKILISNKERELMFKVKKLNEDISKMKPVNDEFLEKNSKKSDFQRGGKMKKLKSQIRSTSFFHDKNYEKITSNFTKDSLNKMNDFYADKFNLNVNLEDNLNLKLNWNSNNNYNNEEIITENNTIFKNENNFKEHNPISNNIKFILFIL